MHNVMQTTEFVERMNLFHGEVTAFVSPEVVVSEYRTIVRLDSLYGVWKPLHNLFEEQYGVVRTLFIVYT